jgi:hypothetical protein
VRSNFSALASDKYAHDQATRLWRGYLLDFENEQFPIIILAKISPPEAFLLKPAP